jgi:HEAT repeat protein
VAALALADIGDKRALPELKTLLDRPANVRILRVLRGAMRRLERG